MADEPADMVGYCFFVVDGPDMGKTFTLTTGVTILGRLDTSAPEDPPESKRWTLTDPAISRTHAQITWDGQADPVLIHLSMTNATLLNGRLVTGQALGQGQSLEDKQVLRLGQTSLEVQKQASTESHGWQVDENQVVLELSPATPWNESGVRLGMTDDAPWAVLEIEKEDAFLLRRIKGALWSTPLRLNSPIEVASGDILRIGERRLTISNSDGD